MSADLHDRLARFRALAAAAAAAEPAAPEPAPPGLPSGFVEAPGPAGPVPVREVPGPDPGLETLATAWAARLCGAELGPVEGWRWLDLETAGLRGGPAFLAGVGRVGGGGFVVRQYLMRDFDRERAFLAALAADLAGGTALITYNGRSFDVPVLRERLRLARLPDLAPRPHWDILPPARRLWGAASGGARLALLQEVVLRLPRGPDVPSAEVPALYRAWLDGDGGALEGVCTHNGEDLRALGALAAALCAALERGPRAGLGGSVLRGLSALYERAGDPEQALAGHALRPGRAGDLDAARLLKRLGRADEAASLWERARRGPLPSAEAAEELAKHLEHRRHDPAAALEVVLQALRAPWLPPARRDALERRLARLRRRTGAP